VKRRDRELPTPAFDIPGAFSILQEIIGRVDALIYATERHFERFGWRCHNEVDDTENPVGHLAHLIGAAASTWSPSWRMSSGSVLSSRWPTRWAANAAWWRRFSSVERSRVMRIYSSVYFRYS